MEAVGFELLEHPIMSEEEKQYINFLKGGSLAYVTSATMKLLGAMPGDSLIFAVEENGEDAFYMAAVESGQLRLTSGGSGGTGQFTATRLTRKLKGDFQEGALKYVYTGETVKVGDVTFYRMINEHDA